MTHKENNLTQFFTDYLNNKSELTATNITMACYSALNDTDCSLNMAEVVFNMRNDLEYIYKVIDDLARQLNKNINSNHHANNEQRQPKEGTEYLTVPEIHTLYSISCQAIRKACNEGRLPYIESTGKNKYRITKTDAELYIAHCKKTYL